jgi:hypothetical protein
VFRLSKQLKEDKEKKRKSYLTEEKPSFYHKYFFVDKLYPTGFIVV